METKIMNRIVLTALIVFSLGNCFFSQNAFTPQEIEAIANSGKESEILFKNSTLNQDGYFYYAGVLADKLYSMKPESANYNYRKGFALLKAHHDYQNAIKYFEKASQSIDSNYDMYGVSEKKSPVDAIFHLATCYHLDGQIDKAIEKYNLFKSESRKSSELNPIADLRLAQCEVAKQLMANPTDIKVRNIGNAVNTDMPDYSPVISLDGTSLYFTSRRPWANNENERYRDPATNQYKEDIYVSYLDFDSSWTEPMRLDFCTPLLNEATSAVSSDERRIYVYQDTTGNGDIFQTDFYHARFNDIVPLKMKGLNTKDWENHAMMNHHKDLLFFVSERDEGLGGTDIYVMKKKGGSWSKPENLGPNINGPMDESSPFIAIDDKTLYFATNDSRSMGGFDLMKSELQPDGAWSEAVNVGYPWNDTDDDLFFTTTLDGKKGYFTSQRKGGHGEKDIYELYSDEFGVQDVAVFTGIVKTIDDSPIPESFGMLIDLTCLDCEDQPSKVVYPRMRDGKFISGLEPCKTYKITYKNMNSGNVMGEDGFTTLCDTAYQEIHREVILDIENNKIVTPEEPEDKTFPDLEFMHYFAYNKNKLDVNEGDLNDFVKEVNQQMIDGREKMTIKIFSSASHVPTRTYKTNENLTKVRANNMKNDLESYLSSKGLDGKVNVVIETTLVQGPKYVRDYTNKEKYFPYQYVGLKTE